MYNPETGLLRPKTADDLDLPEAWRQGYVDQKTIYQKRGGVKTEDDLPEAWKRSSVDVAQQKPTGNAMRKRKRKSAWETDVAQKDFGSENLESMSRLFSRALKYEAFNSYGLMHLEGGWFNMGELLSQDKFEKYSVEDVKWLVACSWHKSRGARFELKEHMVAYHKEDAVEYHKAYFIRATSDKRIFR